MLSAAQAWIDTGTYTAERDYLAAHPGLLEPAADTAVAEALLTVPEDAASLYSALRKAARRDGAEAAYRPLLQSWPTSSPTLTPASSAPWGSARKLVEASIAGLKPGAYAIDVAGLDEGSPFAPVSSDVLVWADPAG